MVTPWTEGTSSADGVTWGDPNGTGAGGDWVSAGGVFGTSDYGTTVYGSLNPATKGVKTADVTGLVQDWYDGSIANNGVALILDRHQTPARLKYKSRETLDPDGPKVTGTWRVDPPNPDRVTRLTG